MEAKINLPADQSSNNNKKYFKLALLLALILNLIVLLFLIFYSLDNSHINFFQVAQRDISSGAMPVYFDIGGSPQGSPSGIAQTSGPQNLSVGMGQQAETATPAASSAQNLSVGFDQSSGQQTSQDNNTGKTGAAAQAFKAGATKASELEFGFDDIENFDKEKAMIKDALEQTQEALTEKVTQEIKETISQEEQTIIEHDQESEKILPQKIAVERSINLQDKVDLSFWTQTQQKKAKSDKDKLTKIIASQNPKKLESKIDNNNKLTSSQKTSEFHSSKVHETCFPDLPKKAGSIFGQQLLEGFKNYMQEQKYSTDNQHRSVSIGTDNSSSNYNSANHQGQSSGELGRSLTSQLKGEVNGMLLIKELALASRLDETMVQSEKFIDKVIPFELTIGEFGKVLNVELKESCGSPSVDRHFVKLVYQSSPINHYARHYKGSPFKIMLSIRFIVPAGANRLLVTYGDN